MMTALLDIAMADGRFYTLIDALRAANLTDVLTQSAPYTLFAPTDNAFAVLQSAGVATLMADTPLLTRILTQHVLAGKVLAAQLILQSSWTTLGGGTLTARADGDTLYIADARIVMRDIEGDDGVIHAIDKVLIPT
jgi:transforming growth factor-beta-induced protein